MKERRYQKSGFSEILRRLSRGIDFVLLLVALRLDRRLPSFSRLRSMSFVELGPGPMRIATLKRLFFRQVFFVDQADFGIPDKKLRIADLEECGDAAKIIALCDPSDGNRYFLFADHCIEHLRPETVSSLLGSLADRKFAVCFRVPNIESSVGKRNFAGDPTHHSAFDVAFRTGLSRLGFRVSPWIRWYRSGLLLKMLLRKAPTMGLAEEIVVSADFS